MNYFFRSTEIGDLTIWANSKAIIKLRFGRFLDSRAENLETAIIKKAFIQLEEYLNGLRKKFDIKLEYDGTDFQKAVWNSLKRIPYGKNKTYKEIADNINRLKSSLAVGGACGKNPLPIFIPCHRVIGSNGNLTGYSGGIGIKRKLLEIETNCKCRC